MKRSPFLLRAESAAGSLVATGSAASDRAALAASLDQARAEHSRP